jgi:two-component system NtrC family sensor kinase
VQLKSAIFLRVALATLLPLVVLVFAATLYSEHLYQQQLSRDLYTSLNSITAEIDRRLLFEREMLQNLVDSPALAQYMPVLAEASEGQIHAEFFPRTGHLNRFLEDFQKIVTSLNTIRVLDVQGNSLIKVRQGRSSPSIFDGIESFPFTEEELDDEEFIRRLRELPSNEVSVILLNQSREEQGEEASLPMMDYIVPLAVDDETIGYLTANVRGEQIDRILDFSPRLFNGRLLIAEINPEREVRHEIILYDDAGNLRFSDIKSTNVHLSDVLGKRLWARLQQHQQGLVMSADGKSAVYFVEYFPYPNLLASWIIATRIDIDVIAAPFERIRLAIVLIAGGVLLLGLVVARQSAASVSRPVSRLVGSLKRFAEGDYAVRVSPEGSDETRQLGDAFNYMADTLTHAQRERDEAQKMMLQSAKLASLGQLAAGIGHEINNPLSNMMSYTKLIERQIPAGDTRLADDVSSLREEVQRASRIVQSILDFARQVPPHVSQFDATRWLRETLGLVQQAAASRNVRLECAFDENYTVDIEADRSQLQQSLVNLLLNAIHASPAGGTVTLGMQRPADDTIEICVRDEGAGIDEAVQDRIFDPFFTTRPDGEGSGLGLSISLGFVERHGGHLTITNHPEGGVLACMRLPLQQKESYDG